MVLLLGSRTHGPTVQYAKPRSGFSFVFLRLMKWPFTIPVDLFTQSFYLLVHTSEYWGLWSLFLKTGHKGNFFLQKILDTLKIFIVQSPIKYPLDTRRKLNVYKTFRSWTSSERLMYVQFMFCDQGAGKYGQNKKNSGPYTFVTVSTATLQTVVEVGHGVSFHRAIPNSCSYGPRFTSTIDYGI